jgi:hypothetical protein
MREILSLDIFFFKTPSVPLWLMRVIHRVPDMLTTHSRQKIAAGGSASILFSFMTCSRLVWSCELVANESWSRLCCWRFGQSTSRMLSCDFYAVRRHHVILQAKAFSWRRNKADCWRCILSVDHLQRYVIYLTTRSRQLSRTSRKLVGNLVDHPLNTFTHPNISCHMH